MNRIRVSLVLLTATLLIAGCARMRPAPNSLVPPAPPACSATGGGVDDGGAPMICVDDSASILKVHPEPFYVFDRVPGGSASPVVHWFSRSGKGDLQVKFADERCVKNVVCNGGHCMAVAARLTTNAQERCKYDVMLTDHPTLDPEGVLTGCCLHP
jgi:hypothetical protein